MSKIYLPLLLGAAAAVVTGWSGYFIGAAEDWSQRAPAVGGCIMGAIAVMATVGGAWYGGRVSAFKEILERDTEAT